MSDSFEKELELQQRAHDNECWRQANQAASDSGIKAISSLFLLNGAAATALLAQPQLGLKWQAIVFAYAALMSIVAYGATYAVNLAVAQTYVAERPEDENSAWIPYCPIWPWVKKDRNISYSELERIKRQPLWFSFGAGLLSLLALLWSGYAWRL